MRGVDLRAPLLSLNVPKFSITAYLINTTNSKIVLVSTDNNFINYN